MPDVYWKAVEVPVRETGVVGQATCGLIRIMVLFGFVYLATKIPINWPEDG